MYWLFFILVLTIELLSIDCRCEIDQASAISQSSISIKTKRLIATERIRRLKPSELFNIKNKKVDIVFDLKPQTQIDLIIDGYTQVKKENFNITDNFVKPIFFVAKGGIAGAGAVSATFGGAIAAFAATEALDKVKDLLNAEIMNATKDVLREKLRELASKNKAQFKKLYGKTPEELNYALNGQHSPVYNEKMTSGADTEEQIIKNTFMLQVIQDELTSHEIKTDIEQKKIAKETKQNIDAINLQLDKTITVQKEFNKQMQNKTSEIAKTEERIKANLELILENAERNIKNNAKDISYLQQYIYGKMSAAEKVAALDNGFLNNMSEQERIIERAKVQLLTDRDALMSQMSNLLITGRDIVTIMNNLDMDPQTASDLSQAVGFGTAAFTAWTSVVLTPPNVISFVAATTTMLRILNGNDSNSTDGMNQALNTINANIGKLENGINKISENMDIGFNKTYQNQLKIYNAILALTKKIDVYYIDTMDKMEKLQDDILINRSLIVEDLTKEINACETVISSQPEYGYLEGYFSSYAKLEEHYYKHKDSFQSCFNGFTYVFPISEYINPVFFLDSYDNRDVHIRNYREKVYQPALDLLKSVLSAQKIKTQTAFYLLYDPSRDYESLINKFRGKDPKMLRLIDDLVDAIAVKKIPPEQYLKSLKNNGYKKQKTAVPVPTVEEKQRKSPNLISNLPIPADELLRSPISSDATVRIVNYLLDLHNYYELFNVAPGENLYTVDEILQLTSTKRTGEEYLKKALEIVEGAIAQQSLLAGDFLLPIVTQSISGSQVIYGEDPEYEQFAADDILQNLEESWTDVNSVSLTVLENNPIMAKNAAIYAINKQMKEQNYDDFYEKYGEAYYSIGDPEPNYNDRNGQESEAYKFYFQTTNEPDSFLRTLFPGSYWKFYYAETDEKLCFYQRYYKKNNSQFSSSSVFDRCKSKPKPPVTSELEQAKCAKPNEVVNTEDNKNKSPEEIFRLKYFDTPTCTPLVNGYLKEYNNWRHDFGDDHEFNIKAGWNVFIGRVPVPLPHPEELSQFKFSSDMETLLALRIKIINEITDYNFEANFAKDELNKNLFDTILLNSPQKASSL